MRCSLRGAFKPTPQAIRDGPRQPAASPYAAPPPRLRPPRCPASSRSLSAQTVRYVHVTLNKVLKQAVADGLIRRYAAASVKAPKAVKKEIRPLDREQANVFLIAVIGERLEPLYVLAITAGLREGELLGLRWEDVDMNSGMLQVRRSLSEARIGRIYEAPKSGKGRNIRLTQRALGALRKHRKRQLVERMKLAGLWQENGLVFPSRVGTPLGGRNLNRSFKRHLERAGLPRSFRFHDLRHTCATILLRQGVNPKYETGRSGFRIWRYRLTKISDQLDEEERGIENPVAPPGTRRQTTTVLRIVRDTAQARRLKELYDYKCQMCGTRLEGMVGPYAEAAHIRPLGAPHHGPDSPHNVLCLCPNHHVLFDHGGVTIAENLSLDGVEGKLHVHPRHRISEEHLRYRRDHYGAGD